MNRDDAMEAITDIMRRCRRPMAHEVLCHLVDARRNTIGRALRLLAARKRVVLLDCKRMAINVRTSSKRTRWITHRSV